VLAYSSSDLHGRLVRPCDVLYVGVSHRGLFQRLHEFEASANGKGGHSAGTRFFHCHLKGKAYEVASTEPNAKRLYYAMISVNAVYRKPLRAPDDLKRLGVAAQLEWYAIARVKEATGKEPGLNVK
jgi:hypothetical protein